MPDRSRYAGDVCACVSGVVHHFKNEGDKPVRMVFMYAPAGFETYFPKTGTPTTHEDAKPQQ